MIFALHQMLQAISYHCISQTIKPVDRTEEISTPDAEAINPDSTKEAIPDTETTATGMANTATFAKFKDTDKRNAGSG